MNSIREMANILRVKYKNSPKKLNKELDKIIKFIKSSDVFAGKKRKLYKLINQYKL